MAVTPAAMQSGSGARVALAASVVAWAFPGQMAEMQNQSEEPLIQIQVDPPVAVIAR